MLQRLLQHMLSNCAYTCCTGMIADRTPPVADIPSGANCIETRTWVTGTCHGSRLWSSGMASKRLPTVTAPAPERGAETYVPPTT